MPLVQRNHEIQALASHRADQPFAIGVRLGCTHWSAQNLQSKVTLSDTGPTPARKSNHGRGSRTDNSDHLEWPRGTLQRPICCGIRGHVVVHNTAATEFHCDENIEHLESYGHRHQDVTSDDALRMILDEGSPVLRAGSPASGPIRLLWLVLANRSR